MLSPKNSNVRKLYEPHAQPFVQIIHGLPESWNPYIAAISHPLEIEMAAWSLCNRLIAISPHFPMVVDILDSATLQRLQTLKPPPEIPVAPQALIFSPDGHMLTCSGCNDNPHPSYQVAHIVSWDLQTGGIVSSIEHPNGNSAGKHQIAYSESGRVVGVLYGSHAALVISIYDVVSGVYMHNINCIPGGSDWLYPRSLECLWTHGEFLCFTTATPSSITMWEVGFTPEATPTQVDTLSILDNKYQLLHIKTVQIAPGSHRVTLSSHNRRGDKVCVWDTRGSKFLLHHRDFRYTDASITTFSSNGHFFACAATGSEVYLWKEHSTGYTLHRKLASGTVSPVPLLSPDGESIITFGGSMVRLWHTNNPLTTPFSTGPQHTSDFVLEFLPNRPLAVVTRMYDYVVVILNLESGVPEFIIEAGMPVYGLGVVRNSIAIIGNRKVAIWDISGRKSLPDKVMRLKDSTQIILFCDTPLSGFHSVSISPNFSQVAILAHPDKGFREPAVHFYNLSTGQHLVYSISGRQVERISPGGDNLWYVAGDKVETWRFNWNATSHVVNVEPEPRETPWRSSQGYKVTDDGWILGLGGKRLLMLPPPWQSNLARRVWNGQFLALLHGSLPEPVILDLEP